MSESTEEAVSDRPKGGGGHAAHEDEHHDANAYPYVQHHYDNPRQQLEAGKLGIWLFLVTEILFFGGLFCAYTIYRAKYPEVFYWAHFYLDKELGAANTLVLILSSLTAAWAVRNAQLGQQKQMITNIVITIACACTFLGIKYVEYSHKFHDGLLPGPAFNPKHELWENENFKAKHPESVAAIERLQAELKAHKEKLAQAAAAAPAQKAAADAGAAQPAAADSAAPAADPAPAAEEKQASAGADDKQGDAHAAQAAPAEGEAEPAAAEQEGEGTRDAKTADEGAMDGEGTAEAEGDAAPGDEKLAKTDSADDAKPADAEGAAADSAEAQPGASTSGAAAAEKPVSEAIFLANAIRRLSPEEAKPLIEAGVIRPESQGNQLQRPERAHMFFSVYFFMTGLHGLHVFIGIIVWVWLLIRATKGQFGPLFFGPIDFAALYWHLVDLIWIYLFPLLYLIH